MTWKKQYNITILLGVAVILAAACSSYDAPFNPQPSLCVSQATDITRSEATVTGQISDNGGHSLNSLRFAWRAMDGAVAYTPTLHPTATGRWNTACRD